MQDTNPRHGAPLVLAAVAGLVALYVVVRFVLAHFWWFAVPVLALGAVGLAVAAVGFVRLGAAGRRNWLPARWHRLGWKRLSRNLPGLAYLDKHLGGADSGRKPKVVYPKVRFRPDAYGWRVPVKLPPAVKREDVERVAENLANAWGCVRVGVTQPGPGRLMVRAMRRDPLTEPLSAGVLPASWDRRHLVLGNDEWGALRRVDMANLSGSVISGNPGQGKTESALSMAAQLVPSPAVDMHILDGGALDWAPFAPAAATYVDDDLAEAQDALEHLYDQMMTRRRTMESDLGVRNAWSSGASPDYRLQWVLIEEAAWFLDLESCRGDRAREAKVRAIRGLVVQLLRRGRAPLFHTTLVVQKATGSGGCPPDIRDLAGLRWAFGVATTEVAVGGLGDDIRQYPTLSPTLLMDAEHVGVATVLLKTGLSPYTHIRFPAIGGLADQVASDAAGRLKLAAVPSILESAA
jgi:hypothetical protein